MYIRIINDEPVSYTLDELYSENPQVSFPTEISDTLLAEYNIYPVQETVLPVITETEVIEQNGYEKLEDGSWVQTWSVRPMNQDELNLLIDSIKTKRRDAYATESDPLFFNAQLGEVSIDDWKAKILEIKTRYPYPESI